MQRSGYSSHRLVKHLRLHIQDLPVISCFRARLGRLQSPGLPYWCSLSYGCFEWECLSYPEGVLLWLCLVYHLHVHAPSWVSRNRWPKKSMAGVSASIFMLIISSGESTLPKHLKASLIPQENYFSSTSDIWLLFRWSCAAVVMYLVWP